MRAPNSTELFSCGWLPKAAGIGLVSALALAQPLAAQQTFSLPEPTPTPTATSAPQGPADERAGVQIGPRIIPQTTPTPDPTQARAVPQPAAATPTPTPAPVPSPTVAATQAPSEPASQPVRASTDPVAPSPARTAPPAAARPTPTPTPVTPTRINRRITSRPAPVQTAPSPAPTPSATPTAAVDDPLDDPLLAELTDSAATGTEVPLGERVDPGFDSLDDIDPVGPDEWYDVSRDGEAGTGSTASDTGAPPASSFVPGVPLDNTQNRIIAAAAALGMLLIIIIAAFVWWRRREAGSDEIPNTVLTSGVRSVIPGSEAQTASDPVETPPDPPAPAAEENGESEAEPPPEPLADAPLADAQVEPEPAPVAVPEPKAKNRKGEEPFDPARIELELDIPIASRSVMMFSVEFSLEVANRSERALRDVNVAAKLSCARRGASNAAPVAGGQPIATIDRIGPQQCRRVTGQLQLPLAEVSAIRQGAKPLFIPLLHVTLEGKGLVAMNRSFVLGTPSAASSSRVHPLPLDGPPGSLPPMRAQALKDPVKGTTEPA